VEGKRKKRGEGRKEKGITLTSEEKRGGEEKGERSHNSISYRWI